MKKLLTALLCLLGFVSCSHARSGSIKTVSAEEFAQLIKADSVAIVDVRTAEEFDAGHIGGAVNIDVLKDGFAKAASSALPKGKTIAVYCRSGKRSMIAANIFAKKGYKVVNLRGGWLEWTEFMGKKQGQ